MTDTFITLEFEQIREQLLSYAATQNARDRIAELTPHLQEAKLRGALHETNDARKILDHLGTPPLPDTVSVRSALTLAEKGGMLVGFEKA